MTSAYRGGAAETMQKAPSTNIQPPEKLQAPKTDATAFWMLMLEISLELGAWNLDV
jgi:hypothetical protein